MVQDTIGPKIYSLNILNTIFCNYSNIYFEYFLKVFYPNPMLKYARIKVINRFWYRKRLKFSRTRYLNLNNFSYVFINEKNGNFNCPASVVNACQVKWISVINIRYFKGNYHRLLNSRFKFIIWQNRITNQLWPLIYFRLVGSILS